MQHHLVFNIVNNHPPMIAIAVQRAGGKRKDTALNIERTGDILQTKITFKILMRLQRR